MGLKIKWAEIQFGKNTVRYTLGTDADDMGFVAPGGFAIQLADGRIKTYWHCPIQMEQEEVPDLVEVPKIVGAV